MWAELGRGAEVTTAPPIIIAAFEMSSRHTYAVLFIASLLVLQYVTAQRWVTYLALYPGVFFWIPLLVLSSLYNSRQFAEFLAFHAVFTLQQSLCHKVCNWFKNLYHYPTSFPMPAEYCRKITVKSHYGDLDYRLAVCTAVQTDSSRNEAHDPFDYFCQDPIIPPALKYSNRVNAPVDVNRKFEAMMNALNDTSLPRHLLGTDILDTLAICEANASMKNKIAYYRRS